MTMRKKLIFSALILIGLLFTIRSKAQETDSIRLSCTLSYYYDLSDTYWGGTMFSGEIRAMNGWYGAGLSYGHFISEGNFEYKIYVEEVDRNVIIPINEVTIMPVGSLSLYIEPIRKKWLTADICLGMVVSRAKISRLRNCYYSYDLANEEFIYLYRDYAMDITTHFGYQAGVDLEIHVTKKMGLEIKSRLLDLSNGGSFFFAGSGFIFKF